MAQLREPGRSRLPELLELNHLTARELSFKLDVTESHISKVISGKVFFSYQLAAKASQLLRCTMEELHDWK
ncbi:helix-turn-helix domain-containing protein [Paenibacillus puldeungensis]|uniref:Helix-turn-helix domain-containing protein n=1 Tax=Paenibacillus puldeungensis TaxID=696536 RepID=A0ABW3S3N6_9BACL